MLVFPVRLVAGLVFLCLAQAAVAQSIEFTTSANPVEYGAQLTLSARALNSPGPFDPSNSYRFRKGGTLLCSATPNSSGIGSCSITVGATLPVGTHGLTVSYEPGGPPGPILPSANLDLTVV